MPNSTQPQAQPLDKNSVSILGTGNATPTCVLQPSIVLDNLPLPTAGMNTVKIEGINGKGAEGGANALYATKESITKAIHSGNVVRVSHISQDAERISITDPSDPNTVYIAIYDVNRAPNKPLGLFKEVTTIEKGNDGKEKRVKTAELLREPISFVERTDLVYATKRDDAARLLRFLIANNKLFNASKDIVNQLKEDDFIIPFIEEDYAKGVDLESLDKLLADAKDDTIYQGIETFHYNLTKKADKEKLKDLLFRNNINYNENLGLLAYTSSKDELVKVGEALVSTFLKVDKATKEKIRTTLQGLGISTPETVKDFFDFIKVFSENLKKNGATKSLLQKSFIEKGLTYPKNGLLAYTQIATKGGLIFGESYLQSRDIANIISTKDNTSSTDAEATNLIKEWARENNVSSKILTEAQTTFGVDTLGNIIINEDTAVPYIKGGSLTFKDGLLSTKKIPKEYRETSEKMEKLRDTLSFAINNAFNNLSDAPREFKKAPSFSEVAKAEQELIDLARGVFSGGEERAAFDSWVSQQLPIVSILSNTSHTENDLYKARGFIKAMKKMTDGNIHKKIISQDPNHNIVKESFLSGDRIRGVVNSKAKSPLALKLDKKEGEYQVDFYSTLPRLTNYQKELANLQITKIPTVSVAYNKEGEAIDIEAHNTLSGWYQDQKFLRVMHAINTLKMPEDKEGEKQLKKQLSQLMEFGGFGNRKDKDGKSERNGFGLQALLKGEDKMIGSGEGVVPMIEISNDIISSYYANKDNPKEALSTIQEKLGSLIKLEETPKNISLINLAKGLIAMKEKELTADHYLDKTAVRRLKASSYNSNDEKLNKERELIKQTALDVLNDKEVKPTKALAFSAAVLGSYLKLANNPQYNNEEREALLKLSSKMGYKQGFVKTFKPFIDFQKQDGERVLYPAATSFYDEALCQAKLVRTKEEKYLVENAKEMVSNVKEVEGAIFPLEEMQKRVAVLQAFYEENKPKKVENKGYYAEQDSATQNETILSSLDTSALFGDIGDAVSEEVKKDLFSAETEIEEEEVKEDSEREAILDDIVSQEMSDAATPAEEPIVDYPSIAEESNIEDPFSLIYAEDDLDEPSEEEEKKQTMNQLQETIKEQVMTGITL